MIKSPSLWPTNSLTGLRNVQLQTCCLAFCLCCSVRYVCAYMWRAYINVHVFVILLMCFWIWYCMHLCFLHVLMGEWIKGFIIRCVFSTVSTFSPVGLLSSNGISVCVCAWHVCMEWTWSVHYNGIFTYQFILCYAIAIHKHTHTRICKPFGDSEPVGLKVEIVSFLKFIVLLLTLSTSLFVDVTYP